MPQSHENILPTLTKIKRMQTQAEQLIADNKLNEADELLKECDKEIEKVSPIVQEING